MDYIRRTSNAFSKRKEHNMENTTNSADKDIEQSSSGADDYAAQPQRAVVDNSMQEAPIQREPIKGTGRNIDQSSALTHHDELNSGGGTRTPVWANMPTKEVPPANMVQQSRKPPPSSQAQQNRKSLVDDARTLRSVHHMPPLPAAGCFDLDAPGNAPIITGYDHDYRSVTAKVAENVAANHRQNLHKHQLEHAAVGSAVGGTAGGAAAYVAGGAAAGIAGSAAVGAAAGGVAAGGIMAKCMEYLRSRESKKTDRDWDELVGGKDQVHDKKLNDEDWQKQDNSAKLDTLGEEGHYTPNGEQVLHSPTKDDSTRQSQAYSSDQDDMASNRAVIDDDVNQKPATTTRLGDDFDHSQDIANGKTPSSVYSYTRDSGAPDAFYGRSIDQSNASHDLWNDSDRQDIKRNHAGLDTAIGAGSGAAIGAATAGAIHRHNASHQKQSDIEAPAYSSAIDPNAKAGQTFDNQGSGIGPSTTDDMTVHNDNSMIDTAKNDKGGIHEDTYENQNHSTFGYGQDKSNLQDSTTPWRQDDSSKRQPDDRNLSNQNNPFIQDKDHQSALDKHNKGNYGPSSFLFDESHDMPQGKQVSSSSTKQEHDIGPSGLGSSGTDKYADYQRRKSADADHKAFDDMHPASNGFDQEQPGSWDHKQPTKQGSVQKPTQQPLNKQNVTQSSSTQEPLSTNQDISQPMLLNRSKDMKQSNEPLSTQNMDVADTSAPRGSTTADSGGMHEPHSTPRGSKSSQSRHWASLSGLGIGGAAAAAAAALTGNKSHAKQHKPTTDDARTDQQLGTSQRPSDDYSRPSQQDFPDQQGATRPTDLHSDQPLDQQPIGNTGPDFVKQTDSTGEPLDQEPITGKYATADQALDQRPSDSTGPDFVKQADSTGQPLDQEPIAGKYAITDQSLDQQPADSTDPVTVKEANVSGQPLDQKPVSGEYATTYERSGIGRNSMDGAQVNQQSIDQSGQGVKHQSTGVPAEDEQLIPEDGQLITEEPISQSGQQGIADQPGTQQQLPKSDVIDDIDNGGLRDTAAQKVDNVPVTQGLQNQGKKRLSQSKPWSGITGLSIGGAAAAAAGALGGSKMAHKRQSLSHIGQAKQTATDTTHPLGGASAQQPDQRQSIDMKDDARTGQQLGTEQQPSDDYSRQPRSSDQKSGPQPISQEQQGMSQSPTDDSRQFNSGTSDNIGRSSYPGENTDTLPATNIDQTDSMGNTGIDNTRVGANRESLDQTRASGQQQPAPTTQRRSEPHITDYPGQQPTGQSRGQRYSSPHIGPVTDNDSSKIHQQTSGVGTATAAGATGGAAAGAAGIAATSRSSQDSTSRPSWDSTHDQSTDRRAMPESLDGATGGVDDDALGAMQSRKKSGKPETAEPGTGTAIGAAAVGAGTGAAIGAAGTHQQTMPTEQVTRQSDVIYGDAPQSVVGQKVIYLDQHGNQISPDQIQKNAIFIDQNGNRISPQQMQKNAMFIDQNGQEVSPEQMQQMSSAQQQPVSGGQQPSSMGAPQQQTNPQQNAPYATAGAVGATAGTAGAASQMPLASGSAVPGTQPQMLSRQLPPGAQLAQTDQVPQGGQVERPNLQDYVDGKIESRRASFKESMGKLFHRSSWQKNGEAMKADAQQKIDSYNAVRRASKEGAAM